MSSNAILTRIELASNDTVLAEGPADSLADLADCAVWVELLSDRACGGNHGGVLLCVLEIFFGDLWIVWEMLAGERQKGRRTL
jgi:hypothetical protein